MLITGFIDGASVMDIMGITWGIIGGVIGVKGVIVIIDGAGFFVGSIGVGIILIMGVAGVIRIIGVIGNKGVLEIMSIKGSIITTGVDVGSVSVGIANLDCCWCYYW